MALCPVRSQDDALSCLSSRSIYSIDSFKNVLWILWFVLLCLHFHQSIINLGECLLCIIVFWYSVRLLWKPISWSHEGRKFFSSYNGWKKRISGRSFLALFLQSVYNPTD